MHAFRIFNDLKMMFKGWGIDAIISTQRLRTIIIRAVI